MAELEKHIARRFIDELEETVIAFLLAAMVVVTFINVVLRYGFNTGLIWGLELVTFLFAWLILFGVSYAVKTSAHLGVDALLNITSGRLRRLFVFASVAFCVIYAALLLKGAWDYWANFANLPGTEGRWFPLGFEEKYRDKGWYEVNDIPHPAVLGWMETVFNEGEEYEKIPRLLPYFILPLSMALMLFRFLQAGWALWIGQIDRVVASHEVEDEIQEAHDQLGEKN